MPSWSAEHELILQRLLATSPAVASIPDNDGKLPWHHAADRKHINVLRLLLPYGPAAALLRWFATGGAALRPLFADFVALHAPLTAEEWALVAQPGAGLGRELPAALEQSTAQAAQLVRRLSLADAWRLRTAALALHRAQVRGTIPPLPGLVVWPIVSRVLQP